MRTESNLGEQSARPRRPKPARGAAALRPGAGGIACIVLALAAAPAHAAAAPQPVTIAVADFDYNDTSGEVRDQAAEHQARLEAFVRALRADLEKTGKYRVVALRCEQPPCSADRSAPDQLVADARRQGARFLLYGGIHKMSTLIQFAKVDIVDLKEDKVVFDKLLTFRGDTDDAWRHAEGFLVSDYLSKGPPF